MTPRTLRFYETKGLSRSQRVNGSRIYTRRDRARLSLILRAKAIGSQLSEIKHFLDLYGAHGEGRIRQARYVLERTDAAIRELEERRRQDRRDSGRAAGDRRRCRRQLDERRR